MYFHRCAVPFVSLKDWDYPACRRSEWHGVGVSAPLVLPVGLNVLAPIFVHCRYSIIPPTVCPYLALLFGLPDEFVIDWWPC